MAGRNGGPALRRCGSRPRRWRSWRRGRARRRGSPASSAPAGSRAAVGTPGAAEGAAAGTGAARAGAVRRRGRGGDDGGRGASGRAAASRAGTAGATDPSSISAPASPDAPAATTSTASRRVTHPRPPSMRPMVPRRLAAREGPHLRRRQRGRRRGRATWWNTSGRSPDHGAVGACVSPAKRRQHGVVVDPPADEVAPGPVGVGADGGARGRQGGPGRVELLPPDADGVVRALGRRRRASRRSRRCGAAPGSPSAGTAPRPGAAEVERGRHQRRRVEHRPGRGDPRPVGLRGAEEHQAGRRAVGLLDVGEPARPLRPETVELVETPDLGQAAQQLDRARRAARPGSRGRSPSPRAASTRRRWTAGRRSAARPGPVRAPPRRTPARPRPCPAAPGRRGSAATSRSPRRRPPIPARARRTRGRSRPARR